MSEHSATVTPCKDLQQIQTTAGHPVTGWRRSLPFTMTPYFCPQAISKSCLTRVSLKPGSNTNKSSKKGNMFHESIPFCCDSQVFYLSAHIRNKSRKKSEDRGGGDKTENARGEKERPTGRKAASISVPARSALSPTGQRNKGKAIK